ncbi:MAG: hypothetical protein CMI52_04215 [Parcubacteria group bacterium]|nr:hypothetical protein [Parcubacteria group bacterium]|tara:strand:- start:3 stop:1007 length:1005 start_codon:yes stop_codon:yes gene_type:complete
MSSELFSQRLRRSVRTPEGRFTLVFVLAIVGIIVVFFVTVLLIDPYGDFETGVIAPIVLKDRTVKTDLLAADEGVDVLIFGSSIAFGLDPRFISDDAFNLSVGGAYPNDHYALLRYAVEELNVQPEKIILAISPASFVNQRHPDISTNPRLRKYVMDDSDSSARDFNPVWIFLKKFNSDYVRDMYRSVYNQVFKGVAPTYSFDDRGFMEVPTSTHDVTYVPDNYDRMFAFFDGVEVPNERYVRYFDKTLAYASEHEIAVDVIILPIHPLTQEQLRIDTSYDAFGTAFRVMLGERNVVVHDLSDVVLFDGLPTGFVDADHLDAQNNTRLMKYLFN